MARMVKLYTPNRKLVIDSEFKRFLQKNTHYLEAYHINKCDQELIIKFRGEYPTLIYPCRRAYRKVMVQYFRVFPFKFAQLTMSLIGQDINLMRT